MDDPDDWNNFGRIWKLDDTDEATERLFGNNSSSESSSDNKGINPLSDVNPGEDFETASTQFEEDKNVEEESEPFGWTAAMAYISNINPLQRSGQSADGGDSRRSSLNMMAPNNPKETDQTRRETSARLDELRQSSQVEFPELQLALGNVRIPEYKDEKEAHYHLSQ
mmetsp:Transcript_8565/g.14230  ORF Transcript_8565/g.14230 Transcript_8565/m.14230 type:complete len:167 (+) Transcript_8565:118-618(+)|eukprot:CAMPEP_0119003792 /NCGR_PEP_ID=MMETSP1176-20130426/769_1 /TAXON_ID=265551 /ORGANISM="Synedropsis recta cf, Strain CCMP1620" /LENGTH=166 /DNA_ID=CAMNT_0006955423 /DNA_START=115 /DNA_END=615 /DNA_ORIENTATION=-